MGNCFAVQTSTGEFRNAVTLFRGEDFTSRHIPQLVDRVPCEIRGVPVYVDQPGAGLDYDSFGALSAKDLKLISSASAGGRPNI